MWLLPETSASIVPEPASKEYNATTAGLTGLLAKLLTDSVTAADVVRLPVEPYGGVGSPDLFGWASEERNTPKLRRSALK